MYMECSIPLVIETLAGGMGGVKMTANEWIGLIPRHVSREWSAETKGDHQLKKLRGRDVQTDCCFRCSALIGSVSVRVMEALLQSSPFQVCCHHQHPCRSLPLPQSDRICTIHAQRLLWPALLWPSIYNKERKQQKALANSNCLLATYWSKRVLSTG